MSEVKVTVLAPGVSRRFGLDVNPLTPGKSRRGRPKKGQGTNGGRAHDWKMGTSGSGWKNSGELYVEHDAPRTEYARGMRHGTGRTLVR